MKKILWITLTFVSLNISAYEVETHIALSSEALKSSVLANPQENVLAGLGLKNELFDKDVQKFVSSNGELRSIENLIKYGSDFEDDKDTRRSLHHFYDPVNHRGLDIPFLDSAVDPNPQRSPDWAIEDGSIDVNTQQYSYKDAMNYFYLALTAQTEAGRNENWGKSFQTLGQIIHHIQDMAQPQHVRNDDHCNLGVFDCVFRHDPSWYEAYTLRKVFGNYEKVTFPDHLKPGAINYAIPEFPTAREFWTTRADDPLQTRRGMADFTNRNFVSQDTNFTLRNGGLAAGSEFSMPTPMQSVNSVSLSSLTFDDGVNGSALCDKLKQSRLDIPFPATGCNINFIQTIVYDAYNNTSSTNTMASSYSIFDNKLTNYARAYIDANYWSGSTNSVEVDRMFTLNQFNFNAAHNYLIPRAVAYSAGLINHFFRGKIDMKPNPNGAANGNDWVVKNLSDEDMQGTFVLYYDHKNAGSQEKLRDPIPGATWNLTIAANSEVAVGSYTVPASALSKTLVFSGRIGAENNVHAGKYLGGWSDPLKLPDLLSGTLFNGGCNKLFVDENGNAKLFYVVTDIGAGIYHPFFDGGNNIQRVMMRNYSQSSGWGDALSVPTNSSSFVTAYCYSVAMNGNNDIALLFYVSELPVGQLTKESLWVQRYNDSSGWSDIEFITGINSGCFEEVPYGGYDPVSCDFGGILGFNEDSNGSVLLAYFTSRVDSHPIGYWNFGDGNGGIWSRRYTTTGGWGNAVSFGTIEELAQSSYLWMSGNAFVMGASGNAAWLPELKYFSPASGWGSMLFSPNSSVCNSYYEWCNKAMDDKGVMFVNGNMSWYVDISTGNVSEMAIVNQGNYYTSPVMDANGNAIVISTTPVVRHYSHEAGWGGDIVLSPTGSSTHLEMAAGGRAVATWVDAGAIWWSYYTP